MNIDPGPDELRTVAILAEVYLRIESARLYGLIDGGPEIDVERCEELIGMAHDAGHEWSEDEIDAAIPEVLGAHL